MKRNQINDGVGESHRDDMGTRKVSKLRPKNQRNDSNGIRDITASMFGKEGGGTRQDEY